MPPLSRLAYASAVVVLCLCTSACSRDQPDAPGSGSGDGSGSGGSGGAISGRERIGWDQRAASDGEVAGLTFRMYVDDQPRDLSEVTCGPISGQLASCSARLPSMSPGAHSLAMTAVNAAGVESERSANLQVVVLGIIAPTSVAGTASASGLAGTEPSVTVQAIVDGMREPTDLAVTPDGRVLIAERAGAVRVVASGRFADQPALVLDDVSLEAGGLLAVTLDPAFARSGLVYVLYTTADGYRVARYRDVGGLLGERVILLDGVEVPPGASAALRFGPDGKLYVALDAGDQTLAGDLGSYNGKVLRLNADGSVPADQAGSTPVFVSDIAEARAIDWVPGDGALWIASGRLEGSGLLNAVAAGRSGRRVSITARYGLPDGRSPSAALFYRGELMQEWQGDLLVALPANGQLLRLQLDASDSTRVASTEIVLDESTGRIRAMALDADGVLYVATDDQLLTVLPAAAAP